MSVLICHEEHLKALGAWAVHELGAGRVLRCLGDAGRDPVEDRGVVAGMLADEIAATNTASFKSLYGHDAAPDPGPIRVDGDLVTVPPVTDPVWILKMARFAEYQCDGDGTPEWGSRPARVVLRAIREAAVERIVGRAPETDPFPQKAIEAVTRVACWATAPIEKGRPPPMSIREVAHLFSVSPGRVAGDSPEEFPSNVANILGGAATGPIHIGWDQHLRFGAGALAPETVLRDCLTIRNAHAGDDGWWNWAPRVKLLEGVEIRAEARLPGWESAPWGYTGTEVSRDDPEYDSGAHPG